VFGRNANIAVRGAHAVPSPTGAPGSFRGSCPLQGNIHLKNIKKIGWEKQKQRRKSYERFRATDGCCAEENSHRRRTRRGLKYALETPRQEMRVGAAKDAKVAGGKWRFEEASGYGTPVALVLVHANWLSRESGTQS